MRDGEGLPLLREALAGRRKVLGEDHPQTQRAIQHLEHHEQEHQEKQQQQQQQEEEQEQEQEEQEEQEEEEETMYDRMRKRRRFH